MAGFEGIGDFDSEDPWQRYAAHQAAKGNLNPPTDKPTKVGQVRKMIQDGVVVWVSVEREDKDA